MIHTEEQILNKVKSILKDLKGEYYKEDCIRKVSFNKEEVPIIFEDKVVSGWIISINSLFGNIDFLIISDETGEPLYYQNFNYKKIEIAKNEEGKYYRVIKKEN